MRLVKRNLSLIIKDFQNCSMPLATNSSRNVNQRIKKNDFRTPQNSGPGNDAHEEKVPHSKSSVRRANMNFFSADFSLTRATDSAKKQGLLVVWLTCVSSLKHKTMSLQAHSPCNQKFKYKHIYIYIFI